MKATEPPTNMAVVGEPHGGDHAKQGAEQSSQHRVGQRGKQGAEFTHKPQQQHHGSSILNHTPAAHLEDRSEDTYIWAGGGGAISCPKNTIQHTGNTFHKNPPRRQQNNILMKVSEKVKS
ncbi:hypothetical protein EYF80_022928 [Liparis tanakae]|uniref:Uncharacterized protein n=1 Tax=Liparis tanakae TaxID=230148 RepID=A0A4Z2HLT9_9TELE|nr:hypothetical protein EYF80_022928 [Liparis tanakae]